MNVDTCETLLALEEASARARAVLLSADSYLVTVEEDAAYLESVAADLDQLAALIRQKATRCQLRGSAPNEEITGGPKGGRLPEHLPPLSGSSRTH